MSKFTLIFKESLQRPRFMDVKAKDLSSLKVPDVKEVYGSDRPILFGVIDYENARAFPAVVSLSGGVMEVEDGDFGELTPPEYFEQQASTQEITE